MQEYYVGENSKEKFSAKIIVIGNTQVGKTSILSRYIKNIFSENNEYVTIGMDYMIKNLEIDDIQMKLEFWDTAGQERFRSVVKHYYNDSQGAVVVFDLTKPKSFNDLKYWVQQLNDFADPMLIKMLVGNKSDIDKTIPMEEIQKFCSLNNFFYYETSAKFNKNIDSCFLDLAKKIKERFYIKTSSNEKCNETFVNFKENLKMIKTKDNDGCKC